MPLTELPLGLPGRVFRSPMPFGEHDPNGEAFQEYRKLKISVVVVLAADEECRQKSGQDLRAFYAGGGLEVVHLPIPDFGVPSAADLERAIAATIEHARAGRNVAVHCFSGTGRTGLFTACVAKKVLGLSGEEAVEWIKRYIPKALQIDKQRQLVLGETG